MHNATVPASPSPAFVRFFLALLVAVGAFLRVHNANTFYYNPDEAMHTGIAAGQNLLQVWQFAHYEIHPPLLYILCHYWMMISTDPAFVRCLPLLFGLGMIPLYYSIGKTLNGEFTGLACAALITFSHGCIIQSYVVRQYMPFVFFLSCNFYCYLHWSKSSKGYALSGYVFFGMLAGLSHFSAIFYFASLGLFGASNLLWPKRQWWKQAQWVLANGVILLLTTLIYLDWRPIFNEISAYQKILPNPSIPFSTLLNFTLEYPLQVLRYISADRVSAFVILLCMIAAAMLPSGQMHNGRRLHSSLLLAGITLATGMTLCLTRIYLMVGNDGIATRHSLWTLPLLLPTSGFVITELCALVAANFFPLLTSKKQGLITVFILISGFNLYANSNRFGDAHEYPLTQTQWTAFTHYLDTLGPSDIIIADKDDAMLLANFYPYMNLATPREGSMSLLMPYRHTYVMFNPHFLRIYSKEAFLMTLQFAQTKKMFDTAQNLIFMKTSWSHSPVIDLMLCPALEKRIVNFSFGSAIPSNYPDMTSIPLSAMVVDRRTFLNDVLTPGKIQSCIQTGHDITPFLSRL